MKSVRVCEECESDDVLKRVMERVHVSLQLVI